MNKIDKSKVFKFLKSLLLALGVFMIFIGIFHKKINDYYEDHKERGWVRGLHGIRTSNLGKAHYDLEQQLHLLVNHISRCKRFPQNLENLYVVIDNPPESCQTLHQFVQEDEIPWIDPWGRMYQIRYDTNNMKIQVRSLGRYVDDSEDDIVKEDELAIKKEVFDAERDLCNSLPKGDKGCAFNRDWH